MIEIQGESLEIPFTFTVVVPQAILAREKCKTSFLAKAPAHLAITRLPIARGQRRLFWKRPGQSRIGINIP